jgi:hypothetical protein
VVLQVIIGTHGRLKNWVSKRQLDVDRISILVFDEADEMLKAEAFADDSGALQGAADGASLITCWRQQRLNGLSGTAMMIMLLLPVAVALCAIYYEQQQMHNKSTAIGIT